jgi:hypothetical protein
MAFNVQQFRASLVNDGARASLFEVVMNLPPAAGFTAINQEVRFKARATSLPGDSVSSISVPYFGREIKVAGTRSFTDWSFTVINDENFMIRNSLETWMSGINSHVGNIRAGALMNSFEYQANATVNQFAKTGEVIKSYTMVGCFPTDVAPIDLDWASGDQIEEFGVTFAYQWWESIYPIPTTDAVATV